VRPALLVSPVPANHGVDHNSTELSAHFSTHLTGSILLMLVVVWVYLQTTTKPAFLFGDMLTTGGSHGYSNNATVGL
jgi:hypothetical protein